MSANPSPRVFARFRPLAALAVAAGLFLAAPVMAHCDAEDGPVAKDVTRALEAADVDLILKWIDADDEAEMAAVFDQALRVREAGGEAQAMADRYVLETAVRLHRLSEGAPYTGIKPAGQPLPAAVVAVDQSMEAGDIDELVEDLQRSVEREVRSRFEQAQQTAAHASHSVAAGRTSVHAYVELVHYVLAVHNTINADAAPGDADPAGHSHDDGPTEAARPQPARSLPSCCQAAGGAK